MSDIGHKIFSRSNILENRLKNSKFASYQNLILKKAKAIL